MEQLTIAVYRDEPVEDFIERIQFILNELGINMTVSESDTESVIYSFNHAERR